MTPDELGVLLRLTQLQAEINKRLFKSVDVLFDLTEDLEGRIRRLAIGMLIQGVALLLCAIAIIIVANS